MFVYGTYGPQNIFFVLKSSDGKNCSIALLVVSCGDASSTTTGRDEADRGGGGNRLCLPETITAYRC